MRVAGMRACARNSICASSRHTHLLQVQMDLRIQAFATQASEAACTLANHLCGLAPNKPWPGSGPWPRVEDFYFSPFIGF